jgi:TatA/E family protein of Tat protein translocase
MGIDPGKILLIAIVALLVIPPDKLPDVMQRLGRAIGEFRRTRVQLESQVRSALGPLTQVTSPGSISKVVGQATSKVTSGITGVISPLNPVTQLAESQAQTGPSVDPASTPAVGPVASTPPASAASATRIDYTTTLPPVAAGRTDILYHPGPVDNPMFGPWPPGPPLRFADHIEEADRSHFLCEDPSLN